MTRQETAKSLKIIIGQIDQLFINQEPLFTALNSEVFISTLVPERKVDATGCALQRMKDHLMNVRRCATKAKAHIENEYPILEAANDDRS
jgi:hypothetical protein